MNQVIPTSTALTASPASPVAQGTPVTPTAAVTPAKAAGTVQFKDGTTNVGTPLTITNGKASRTISTLAAGSHQLTTVFTPHRLSGLQPLDFASGVADSDEGGWVISGVVAVMPSRRNGGVTPGG
jgi:Bacterial Ig-like domain (group 3)